MIQWYSGIIGKRGNSDIIGRSGIIGKQWYTGMNSNSDTVAEVLITVGHRPISAQLAHVAGQLFFTQTKWPAEGSTFVRVARARPSKLSGR